MNSPLTLTLSPEGRGVVGSYHVIVVVPVEPPPPPPPLLLLLSDLLSPTAAAIPPTAAIPRIIQSQLTPPFSSLISSIAWVCFVSGGYGVILSEANVDWVNSRNTVIVKMMESIRVMLSSFLKTEILRLRLRMTGRRVQGDTMCQIPRFARNDIFFICVYLRKSASYPFSFRYYFIHQHLLCFCIGGDFYDVSVKFGDCH